MTTPEFVAWAWWCWCWWNVGAFVRELVRERVALRRWWRDLRRPLCECGEVATQGARFCGDDHEAVTYYCRRCAGVDL